MEDATVADCAGDLALVLVPSLAVMRYECVSPTATSVSVHFSCGRFQESEYPVTVCTGVLAPSL